MDWMRCRPSRTSRHSFSLVGGAVLSGVVILLVLLLPLRSNAEDPGELGVKGAFLFNFARYIEWPEGTFPAPDSPIVFGIFGDSAFFEAFRARAEDKSAASRGVEIREVESLLEIRVVHILFVGASRKADEGRVLAALNGAPVFTISDSEGFAEDGGTAHFFMREQSIRFAINKRVARESGLKISSKLLRFATLVD